MIKTNKNLVNYTVMLGDDIKENSDNYTPSIVTNCQVVMATNS